MVSPRDPEWDHIEHVHAVDDYNEYLGSPGWKQKRDYALQRAGYRCQLCNRQDHLEVHHRTYDRLGHEDPTDLTVLCRRCHGAFHASGHPVTGDGPDAASWIQENHPRIVALAFTGAAIWAFLNMNQWATYDADPAGYLWRFARFLVLVVGAIAFYGYPPTTRFFLGSGGVVAVILFLTWYFG